MTAVSTPGRDWLRATLMGKITGFLEIERQDRSYEPAADRVRHYREFLVPAGRRRGGATGRPLHGLRHPLLPPRAAR